MIENLRIGPLSLPTSPLLLILGFYLGLWFAARVAARRRLDADHLYNAGFYAAIAAIVGGRLGHIIRFSSAYLNEPLSALSPNLAAFHPLVAIIAAVGVMLWYQRRYAVPPLALFDALAAGALLTLAAVALADGFNGRHFGEPSMLPWAITQWDVDRHPVQFYELVGTLIAASALWFSLPRLKLGQAGLAAVAGYAAVRLFIDAFRSQPALVGDGFRLSQVIALVVLLVALLALYQMQGPGDGKSITMRWDEGSG